MGEGIKPMMLFAGKPSEFKDESKRAYVIPGSDGKTQKKVSREEFEEYLAKNQK